jgi:AcrR family transcriptional regulator
LWPDFLAEAAGRPSQVRVSSHPSGPLRRDERPAELAVDTPRYGSYIDDMARIANGPGGRIYRSELRTRQADSTRTGILDAALRVMARGIATLTVPDVAREAGVSVPTVYRHFPTKQELLDSLYPYLERRAGRSGLVVPTTMAEFRVGVRRVLEQLDSFDDMARAALASPAAEEARARSMPRRIALIRAMVDTIEPPLRPASRERLTRLVVVLTSSAALRAWRDHLGTSPDEVADEIEAIVEAVIAAERERER